MASVRKRKRKDGSMFYEIQVSRGRGLSPYTMRWDRPEGLAEKTIQSQLRTVAVNFENDCKAGKVKTRKEEKEAAELEREEREKAEKDKVTFRRFCNESFLPAIRARASQTSAYNYELQLAYCGFDPTIIQSGKSVHYNGPISKRGNSTARKVVFYTVSTLLIVARKINPQMPLLLYYEKKRGEGKHHHACIVACCTKLLRILLAMSKQNTPYK